MADQRVDKRWQSNGLDAYSTEAVLGTLGHYGVKLDEAGFKALAQQKLPMEIAYSWMHEWKGTGQFSHFPASAVGVLWARLTPELLAPQTLASAWSELVAEPSAAHFESMQQVMSQLPAEGARRDNFLSETVVMLSPLELDPGQTIESLAAAKRDDDAERFAGYAEALYPGTGVAMRARVKAGRGDRAGALAELGEMAADPARPDDVRFAVVTELLAMHAVVEALAAVYGLHEQAVAGRDVGKLERLHELMHEMLHHLAPGPERDHAMQMVAEQHQALEGLGHSPHG